MLRICCIGCNYFLNEDFNPTDRTEMKNRVAKLLAAFAAFGVLSSSGIYAADMDCGTCPPEDCSTCAPLDIHKHKVYVNPHELDNCKVRFCGKECSTKKLTFSGLIQADYDYVRVDDRGRSVLPATPAQDINGVVGSAAFIGALNSAFGTDVKDPAETGHFQMRRVRLGVDADLGNCWYGRIDLDLRTKCETQCAEEGFATLAGAASAASDLALATSCKTPCGDPQSPVTGALTIPNITAQQTVTVNRPRVNADACNQSLSNKFFTLNEAYIEKIYEGNSFKVGYKKVNFGVEEGTHAAHLATIERSAVTNYFTGFMGHLPCRPTAHCGDSRLGMGNRHVGIFMDGEYHNFGYGLAVTNGYQGLGKSSKYANEVGLYGNAYYDTHVSGFGLTIGFNIGYQPEGNTNWMATQGRYIAVNNQLPGGAAPGAAGHPVSAKRSSILAWNPYATVTWHNTTIMAELMGARVQNGTINVSNQISDSAKPLGFNIVKTYRWDDHWEFVSRYTHLDTDERGVRIANVIPGANNVLGVLPSTTTNIFNEIDGFYYGVNYYIKNKSVKFSLGYEHIAAKGRWGNTSTIPVSAADAAFLTAFGVTPGPIMDTGGGNAFGGDKAKIDAVRARLQIIF